MDTLWFFTTRLTSLGCKLSYSSYYESVTSEFWKSGVSGNLSLHSYGFSCMGECLELLCLLFNSVQAVAESSIPSPTPMDIVTSARFVCQKDTTFMGVGGVLS